jgi:hypothetical protein
MPRCLTWGEQRIKECTDWRDNGHEECTDWRDDGYSECQDWDRNCCDWWPCSWGCKIISWICTASVWISSWVCYAAVWIAAVTCVAWATITTAVCVVWDFVVTVVNAVIVSVESIFGWVLSAIAAVVEIILSIPIIGALVRWIISLVEAIIWTIVSIIDAVAGLLGIRPEKLLRVCPVILADELSKPVDTLAHAVDQLQIAANILKRDANIRLIPSAPFKYATGFSGAPVVTEDWIKVLDREPGDPDTLDPPCDAAAFGADLGVAGSKFNLLMTVHCFYGTWRRLLGYGGPVSVFFVRSVQGGGAGCGTWIVDFVTVATQTMPLTDESLRRVACHELGHAGNLWHIGASDNPDNLMATPRPSVSNVMDFKIYDWQVLLLRASKHVTYF